MKPRVTKKCARCGHVAKVRPRQRHCYQRRFGRGSYACWGALAPMVRLRKNKEALVAQADSAEAEAKRMQQYRDDAARKRNVAVDKVDAISKQIARLSKRLREYQRKERLWSGRAAMTDAELAAERARKQEQSRGRQKPKRGIALGGFD